MSAADPTLAARARRHRERKAEEDASMALAMGRLADLLERLTVAVEALRNGGGNPVDNPASTHAEKSTSVAQRRRGGKRDADARTEGAPPPPTGVGGATTEDDAQAVLGIMDRPGSLAAITDAADLPRTRTAAALVYLQGHGLVRRVEGSGLEPDRWHRIEGATWEPLADHPARPLQVEPGIGLAIRCEDYQAHAIQAHRWDPALGRFRCSLCEPTTTVAPGPGHRPPAPGPGTVTPGGSAHA